MAYEPADYFFGLIELFGIVAPEAALPWEYPFIGLVAGLAIAFVTTWFAQRAQRRLEWQGWLKDAAADHAAKLKGASMAIDHAISYTKRALDEGEEPGDQEGDLVEEQVERIDRAAWLVNELPLTLSRVQLLFAENARVREASSDAFEDLQHAVDHLRDYHHKHLKSYRDHTTLDPEGALEFLNEAQESLDSAEENAKEFMSEAHQAILKFR